MLSNLNSSLLAYLGTQNQSGSSASGSVATASNAKTAPLSQAAMQRAAGAAKAAGTIQSLETQQRALGSELRAAMNKAGVKLEGAIEFSVKVDGSVSITGSSTDKAATQAFLKADTSQPSFASRIATQARDAMKVSTEIQQSAAISQAARLAKSSGGVMSLYASLMQQTSSTRVVFSLSAGASTLTYPGSLTANA